jgi:hypothetical protein
MVSPAVDPDGVGGKGRISCALAVVAHTAPSARPRTVSGTLVVAFFMAFCMALPASVQNE